MKIKVLFLGLTACLAVSASGQGVTSSAASGSSTQISQNGKELMTGTETSLSATLQKSLNVEKAKVGDQVVLKTTKTVKQNGDVVIEKGSRLVGRITDIQRKTKDSAGSKVAILFDKLQQGDTSLPVNVSIVSVTSAAARTAIGDDLFAESAASSSTTARGSTSAGSGGLLGSVGNTAGGLGNTVGGVANSTVNTVGSTVNTVGSTTGATAGSVGRSVRGLQIVNSADASVGGSSTLSLTGGNLKLQEGTSFQLAISSSSIISAAKAKDKN